MILLDLSQIIHSTVAAQVGFSGEVVVDEGLIRHMILNTLRANKVKFQHEYGQLVIARDSNPSWRKALNPYYKANRKKARKESPLDWKQIYQAVDVVTEELAAFFPYPVVRAPAAEADDVIATLAFEAREDVLILSGDRDFVQLHSEYVRQYDPVRKNYVQVEDPGEYLKEKIVRGDSVDGVPNILMPADFFVNKKDGERQKTISKKMLEDFKSLWMFNGPDGSGVELAIYENWNRNVQMIDLKSIPESITEDILRAYGEQQGKDR